MKYATTLYVVLMMGTSTVLAQPADESGVAATAAVPPEAAAWVKANAIRFDSPEAGRGFGDLAPLKALVGDARIVSLGEPTHGTREAFQLKHRLLEYLATELGFTLFSIEANMPESYELNQYVLEGKGDPKKLIGGMYFWTWNTEEVLAMVEWMREYNKAAASPVRFTGFDMQTPTMAMGIVAEFVREHIPDDAAAIAKAYDTIARAEAGSGDFGVGTGSFPVEAARGKKLIFSGWIRTENVQNGWAGLWWRTDGPNGVLSFENMNEHGPRGTTPWTRYEFALDVPQEVTNINFGVLMPGDGAAWFDDLEVRLDGEVFTDPERFSFDFENDTVRFLAGLSRGYSLRRTNEQPHGGTTCLELRKTARADAPDPEDAERAADEAAALLKERRERLVESAGEKETAWAEQNARIVRQYARMMNAGDASGGSNYRDRAMADNVEWILGQNPGAKIVLWAHNAHVSRAPIWGQIWMGSHLEKKFPGQMVVFGFSTGFGHYTAVESGKGLSDSNALEHPPAQSVEAYLAAAETPMCFLDIRAAKQGDEGSGWAAQIRPMRSIGAMAMNGQFTPVNPKQAFDILVYQDRTTAAKQLDTRPGR
ncbi:MAG: erythromycin esterase family protein [Phycisphaerae bacterium]|nr:erythromycin esterase family protein [Phycisphaerae bacterium]